jgi:hypothetical protein
MMRSMKQKIAAGAPKKSMFFANWASRPALSSRSMPIVAYMSSPTLNRDDR